MHATEDHLGIFLLCLAGIATLSGCSDGRPALYPAQGTVVFSSGGPVRNATIEFVPNAAGPSPRGRIDAKGRFSLGTYETNDGAPAGETRVVALKHATADTSDIACTVEPNAKNEIAIVVDPR